MQIHDAQTAMKFIMGGKAIFTIVSLKTGKRYTYRSRAVFPQRLWFIEVLTGSDNTSDYLYLGAYRGGVGYFGLSSGRSGRSDHPAFAALDWMLMCLYNGHMPTTAEFWHEGRCARCGRTLTTPESIESGFGPECVKKAGAV